MTIITDILKGANGQAVQMQSPLIFPNQADIDATIASLGIVKPINGNWIPSLGGNSVLTIHYARFTDYGTYIKVTWDFTVVSLGTGSLAQLHGLPIPCGDEYGHVNVTYYNGAASSIYGIDAYVENDSTHLQFAPKNGASNVIGSGAFFANSTRCFGEAIYKKAI